MAMEDSAGISLRDTKGKPHAVAYVTDDESQIVLNDGENDTLFSAPESK